jgi:hypothetical protein
VFLGGVTVHLDLPDVLGKTSDVINVRQLKSLFFHQGDAEFDNDDAPHPLFNPLAVECHGISRILWHQAVF